MDSGNKKDFKSYIDEYVFKKFDKDNNFLLSAKEIGQIFERYMSIRLSDQEQKIVSTFLWEYFRRTEVKKAEFRDLLDLDFYQFGWKNMSGFGGIVKVSDEMMTAKTREGLLNLKAGQ